MPNTLFSKIKAKGRRARAWLRSRTMRLGLTGVTLIPVMEYMRAEMPAVREFVPDSAYKALALGAFVAMLWLRLATTQPVSAYERKPAAEQRPAEAATDVDEGGAA